ncbi:MAG: AMP-binding protein, partial [Hyphomicrobiales bacterium]|nr:AMP-binding protein [Hyphomicrobiales bacterium]
MSEVKVYEVPAEWKARAFIDSDKYQEMYKQSVEDPEGFWREQGKRIDWIKPYTKVKNTSYDYDNVSIKWYEDGTLNVCANCVDRHADTKGDQPAIIWEGDDPNEQKTFTYSDLKREVSIFANALKEMGARKGDRVTVYMPMIPEAAFAMLACARIGAIHSVVFGGFSPDSLAKRIVDCESKFIVTADEGLRGKKPVPLKANTDEALKTCKGDEKVL